MIHLLRLYTEWVHWVGNASLTRLVGRAGTVKSDLGICLLWGPLRYNQPPQMTFRCRLCATLSVSWLFFSLSKEQCSNDFSLLNMIYRQFYFYRSLHEYLVQLIWRLHNSLGLLIYLAFCKLVCNASYLRFFTVPLCFYYKSSCTT